MKLHMPPFMLPPFMLLEAVPGTRPGEQQELPHPAHQVRLVLVRRQVLVAKELGVSVEHFAQLYIAFRHIQLPVYPDLDNTRLSVVMHGRSSRNFGSEGVHRSIKHCRRLETAVYWR